MIFAFVQKKEKNYALPAVRVCCDRDKFTLLSSAVWISIFGSIQQIELLTVQRLIMTAFRFV